MDEMNTNTRRLLRTALLIGASVALLVMDFGIAFAGRCNKSC
jgi:hypothetical protein